MFLEVPLAGLAAANATEETAAALQAAIDEAAGHEPGTPPFNDADKRFHQILAERGRQRAAARLHRLDPRGPAAAADRDDRPARGRGRDPAPAPRHPARRAPPPARGRREGDAGAHRVPAGRSARRVAQRVELLRRQFPLEHPLDAARPEPHRDAHRGVEDPYSPSAALTPPTARRPRRSPRPAPPRPPRSSTSRSGSGRARRGAGTRCGRRRRGLARWAASAPPARRARARG